MANQAPPVLPARPGDPTVTAGWRSVALLAAARRGHAGLYWFAAAMAVTAGLTVVGLAVDHRVLLGAPLWTKPLKFALSFGLYTLTLAWMLAHVRRGRRIASAVGWVVVAMSAIEMVIIIGQAARGRRSHFNADTALDSRLFSIMGTSVAVLWLATVVLAVVVLRQRIADRALAWSIRLGLLVALAGMAVGVLMTAQPGGGAHSVGVPDGGAGLPLIGWSTTGGDLRVGHFVGIHALQVIPLLGALLAGVPRRLLPERARLGLVTVTAAGYVGLVALLTWQALRGQPLVAPDGATWAAFAALVTAVGLGAVLVVAGSRRATRGRA